MMKDLWPDDLLTKHRMSPFIELIQHQINLIASKTFGIVEGKMWQTQDGFEVFVQSRNRQNIGILFYIKTDGDECPFEIMLGNFEKVYKIEQWWLEAEDDRWQIACIENVLSERYIGETISRVMSERL